MHTHTCTHAHTQHKHMHTHTTHMHKHTCTHTTHTHILLYLSADILAYLLLCFQLHHVHTSTAAADGASGEGQSQPDGALPRIFDLAVWFDCIKILIFKYSFWLTLFLVFLFSTLQISLFGWFYLLLCFIFLFRGQNILKDTQSHRIKWYATS